MLLKQYKGLWLTGLGSITTLAFTMINFQTSIADIKSKTGSDAADILIGGLTDILMQSVQIQWGVGLLVVGVALIIASAAIKDNSRSTKY